LSSLSLHVACAQKFYGISSNFTKFGKGFLNPSLYLAVWGAGMSSVTFTRNRVKLKKLLGIRARLAMLAVMMVAPLMLERVRSLEDISRLYPRFQRHRAQLRNPACQPADQPALDSQHHDRQ
jgi:hypothetical protein